MHRSIFRLLLLLVASFVLQGCSAVRLGYGNADTLARWWIEQYVDLSPAQNALTRDRLVRLHAWHRKTQLTDYVLLARQAQQLVAGQPTVADAMALVDGVVRRGRTLAEQATPDIADLLSTVTPEQIEQMAGRFAEKNAEYAEEARLADGDSAMRKAYYKRVLERTEHWFGDFSNEQEAVLRRRIDGQAIGSQFWYDERLRRQREWLDLARQVQRDHPPRERIIQLLQDYAAHFDMPRDPARLLQAQTLRRNSAELFVASHPITTPAQRAHAQRKLDNLIRDFVELSREE